MDPPAERSQRHGVGIVDTISADGEVVGVSVLQSSGNSAFDRSAMNALSAQGDSLRVAKLRIGYSRRTFAVSS